MASTAPTLTAGVLVRDPSGALRFLPAGSRLPDWAKGLVGDHVLSQQDQPREPSPEENAATAAAEAAQDAAATANAAADVVSTGAPDGPPPRAGRGSSTDTWARYAAAHGVKVEAGAERHEIIEACRAAKVPVD